MGYREIFAEELAGQNTQYFIFDTKGTGKYGDVDFIKYRWDRAKYNLVNPGDVFIYRKPSKSSENHQFYFFGACKVGPMVDGNYVTAQLEKQYPFPRYVFQQDLTAFPWGWKNRGTTWEHFFNQYGMNKITKADFTGLLDLADMGLPLELEYDNTAATEAVQAIEQHNYGVPDNLAIVKVRAKQQMFSNQVKTNYSNRCAICGISTKDFLIGSHIIPWAKRADIRLDPANGICLCALHDRAFDAGYIALNDDFTIKLSPHVTEDKILNNLLQPIYGFKIDLPKIDKPKIEYLAYHRDHIYKV